MWRIRRLLMMGARVLETCRAEYNKVLMILRLLCIWLVLYSLLSSLMHGTMNLKFTNHIFCIRQIYEKKWEYNEAVHQLFIDFKKAYDSVRSEVFCNILFEFGIPMNW
jgi:hypothetical protein